jgi:arachidonate 15-lipoxygenase (second type)/8-lipoxygenase (S-type)
MSRLSINLFSIRRLNQKQEHVSLSLDPVTAKRLSGMTVDELLADGRLFVVDYSSQASLIRTNLSAAACDVYFFIHPNSSNFLPLAIVTNTGANLTYTPLDTVNDWLLAKIMFNVNDLWFATWYHFAGSHFVVEIVTEAAICTLSDNHPVFALVKRRE